MLANTTIGISPKIKARIHSRRRTDHFADRSAKQFVPTASAADHGVALRRSARLAGHAPAVHSEGVRRQTRLTPAVRKPLAALASTIIRPGEPSTPTSHAQMVAGFQTLRKTKSRKEIDAEFNRILGTNEEEATKEAERAWTPVKPGGRGRIIADYTINALR